MIELIFVIVILGILAAVAVPKLAATRDDAVISMIAHNTMTAAFEVATYATAQGRTEVNINDMSKAMGLLVGKGLATDTGASRAEIRTKPGASTCLIFRIENVGGNTEILRLEDGGATDENCQRLQNLIDFSSYPMPLRGNVVSL
jgi:type II secretory pathway pseudopilin PulG